MHNVRDFGAVGDGTADDTLALAAAIAAATVAGGVVYLPAGTYRTTAPLVVNARRVAIRGDGPQNTYLSPDLASGQYALSLGWDANAEPAAHGPNLALEGLTLLGPTGPAAPNGLHLQGFGANPQAHSMTIRDVGFHGFDVQVDLGRRTYLDSFERVFFTAAHSFGLRLGDVDGSGENISLSGCVFSGIYGTALMVDKSGASVFLSGCSFDYCKRAIWQRAGHLAASMCHFETGTEYGPGGEYLLLDRRGYVDLPMMVLDGCRFHALWDNYDCAIRCSGEHGDNGLRLINPHIKPSTCPYLIRDDGGWKSSIVVSGIQYGQGGAPAKLRRNDGTDYALTPAVTHVVA